VASVSRDNFGLLIAYLIPGFTALWGASYYSATLKAWLGAPPTDAPSVGGFLYVTVGSLAAGLVVSTVRWAVIDTLHHRTGIREPQWDFARLQENISAFNVLVEIHYRYYQFYGGMLTALAFVYVARRLVIGFWSTPIGSAEVGFLLLEWMFWAGSRDTLRKYYKRVGCMLVAESNAVAAYEEQPIDADSPTANSHSQSEGAKRHRGDSRADSSD
jgi:hypothetical protein